MASCDMCGKDTRLFRTKIEGTVMNVCRSCSRHGQVLKEVRVDVRTPSKETSARIYVSEEEEVTEDIVPDYAGRIKRARQKKKMDQEDFAKFVAEKGSVISKLETGQLKPSLKLARKLQNRLGIKLIQKTEEEKYELRGGSGKGFTIGDIIKTKKKR